MASNIFKKSRILLTTGLLLFASCTQNSYEENLRGDVTFVLDDKIKSISQSKDENFWIGSVTGMVYNTKEGKNPLIETEEAVYTILDDIDKSNSIFVCVRDHGVQQWRANKSGRFDKIKVFKIKVRGYKYSPYCSIKINNTIFYGTSNGLYRQTDADSLELIYPSYRTLAKTKGEYAIRNLVPIENAAANSEANPAANSVSSSASSTATSAAAFAASTPEGLIILNGQNLEKRVLPNKDISYASTKNNLLYINAGDSLYTIDLDGKILHKKCMPGALAFINTKENIGIAFSLHSIAFHNCTKKESTEFKTEDLIPIDGNNRSAIMNDANSQTVYYASGNKIIAIPYQAINVKLNKSASIIDNFNQSTYAVSGNILFIKHNPDSTFKHYLTLPKGFQAEYLAIKGHDVYVADKSKVLKINPRVFASLESKSKLLFSGKDINSIIYSDYRNSLLVGSRFGTYELKPDGSTNKLNDFYIKTLRINSADKRTIYLNTQNKGLIKFDSKDSTKTTGTTGIYENYRDIDCFISADETILGQDIILAKSKIIKISARKDTIPVAGVFNLTVINRRLLVGTGVSGIFFIRINDDKTLEVEKRFNEITFLKNSCTAIDEQSFTASSKYGTWVITQNGEVRVPTFNQNISENTFKIVLVSVCILVLLTIMLIISETRKYIIKRRLALDIIYGRNEERTLTLQRSAQMKIKELKLFTLIFNDDSEEISEINSLIKEYEHAIKNCPDEFEVYVNNLTKTLTSLNRVVLEKISAGLPFMKSIPSIDGLTAEKLERAKEITKDLLKEKKHERFIYQLEEIGSIQDYFESSKIKEQIVKLCSEMTEKTLFLKNQENATILRDEIEVAKGLANSPLIVNVLKSVISLNELYNIIYALDYIYILIKRLEEKIEDYELYAKSHSYNSTENQKITEINDLVISIRRSSDKFYDDAPQDFVSFVLNDLKMNNPNNQQSRYLILLLAYNDITNLTASKILFRDSRDTKSIIRKKIKENSNNYYLSLLFRKLL